METTAAAAWIKRRAKNGTEIFSPVHFVKSEVKEKTLHRKELTTLFQKTHELCFFFFFFLIRCTLAANPALRVPLLFLKSSHKQFSLGQTDFNAEDTRKNNNTEREASIWNHFALNNQLMSSVVVKLISWRCRDGAANALAKVGTFMICPKLPPRCRMMNTVEKEASVDCSASRCFLASLLFFFP